MSSHPRENGVDDAAAPVSITTQDDLNSPSPIVKGSDLRSIARFSDRMFDCLVHLQY